MMEDETEKNISPEGESTTRDREIVLDFIGEKKKKTSREDGVGLTAKKNNPAPLIIKKTPVVGVEKKRGAETGTVKIIFHVTTFSMVLFLVFYSWFAFMVICFRVDNTYSRSLSKLLPVPAVISRDVFVEYYQYKDQEDRIYLQLVAKNKEGRIWSLID